MSHISQLQAMDSASRRKETRTVIASNYLGRTPRASWPRLISILFILLTREPKNNDLQTVRL